MNGKDCCLFGGEGKGGGVSGKRKDPLGLCIYPCGIQKKGRITQVVFSAVLCALHFGDKWMEPRRMKKGPMVQIRMLALNTAPHRIDSHGSAWFSSMPSLI